ncbi:MAG: hypothetical protein EZS28_040731 [Streblomastix strix]|uniref:Uncharacterized protein n=1 Tax=Streblomastix strix TaxID=222440 RepID=A0A5J4U172_9EUKA|nr:MAG: hypothetical protein EZS28_040731 [Streblomastix strix]
MQENENRFFQERLTNEEMIEDIRKLDYITFHEVNFEDSDALMLTEPMLSAPFRRQVRLHRLKYPEDEKQEIYYRKRQQ